MKVYIWDVCSLLDVYYTLVVTCISNTATKIQATPLYSKSKTPYPFLPAWFLLPEPLSALGFLLSNVIFSSNGLTLKLLDTFIPDSHRHPPGSTSYNGNIFFLIKPGVFPGVDTYTICSLQCTPVQGYLVSPVLKLSVSLQALKFLIWLVQFPLICLLLSWKISLIFYLLSSPLLFSDLFVLLYFSEISRVIHR